MREATLEEQRVIQENIDKVSRPTGVNFWSPIEAIEEFNNQKWLDELKEQYNKCSELFDIAWAFNNDDHARNELSKLSVWYLPDVMQTLGYYIGKLEYILKGE